MKTSSLLVGLLGLTVGCATTQAAWVTFQVNMSAQVALGDFTPETGAVFVAGDPINGWSESASPLEPSVENADIWTGTYEVTGTAGNTCQYKFVMLSSTGATVWEGNVGTGGGTGNRTLIIADTDQTLDVVYFNNVTSGTSVTSEVTFQVNMSVQTTLGNFDPETGAVYLAGEFNEWSTSATEMTRSTTNPDLWTVTMPLTGAADSAVGYKFIMLTTSSTTEWEGNVGTGGSQNRSLTLTSGAQTLPVAFFNNLAQIPTNIPLTFQVSLGVLIAQGAFDPNTGTVSVAGDPLNSWSATASVLTPSATDSTVYTGTFEVNGVSGTAVAYKYVLNGATWESIDNRVYTTIGAEAQTLPLAHFNNVDNLGSVTLGTVANGQIALSWTAGPGIRLQQATDLGGQSWADVPNTLGQGAATVPIGSGTAFLRLVGP